MLGIIEKGWVRLGLQLVQGETCAPAWLQPPAEGPVSPRETCVVCLRQIAITNGDWINHSLIVAENVQYIHTYRWWEPELTLVRYVYIQLCTKRRQASKSSRLLHYSTNCYASVLIIYSRLPPFHNPPAYMGVSTCSQPGEEHAWAAARALGIRPWPPAALISPSMGAVRAPPHSPGTWIRRL
jgi:hypothetical protein